MTFDRDALCKSLQWEVGYPDFFTTFIGPRTHLFSNAPVFLSKTDITKMLRIVHAVEAATRLPGYRDSALSRAPENARMILECVASSCFTTFYLASDGPKLIEVNTKAGGAFLNAVLVMAQRGLLRRD